MKKHEIIIVEEKRSGGFLKFVLATVALVSAAAGALTALKVLRSKQSRVIGKIDIDGDGEVDATMIDTDGDGEVDTIVFHDDE